MKIYDISQEVFSCEVFPGDEPPQKEEVMRMSEGALYNLTSLHMCAHNGTHVDAPFHFIEDGATIEQIPLVKMIGPAFVVAADGEVTEALAKEIILRAKEADASHKILIKGRGIITVEAAKVFADAGIDLIGVELQSVGPVEAPMAVHKVLLGAQVVLLEGLRLEKVSEGAYFLNAAPLSLGGSDGAPCRAILLDLRDVLQNEERYAVK